MSLLKVSNPPQRYAPQIIEWLDEPPSPHLEVFEETARSIITKNKSPDIAFEHSINPYRGCFHGCCYCYARPGHQYLDFGAGTDFERKIVVKVNAPALLREAFMKRSWNGDLLVYSGVTDCYQPLEATYEITRQCLEVCAEFHNPVALITKGALIRRDIDVLKDLATDAECSVTMSIAFNDDAMSKKLEPFAPRPSVRFKALEALSQAGIPVGVGIAPVIPAMNDSQIPAILTRARDLGAEWAFMTLLRLPAEVKEVFTERLTTEYPDRAGKVLSQLKDMRDGELYRPAWGRRMHGNGPRWEATEYLFQSTCDKLRLRTGRQLITEPRFTFRRPQKQLELFGLEKHFSLE